MTVDEIVRVISIRSDNPRGFGGCIFSARPIDPNGNVRDARKHVVVEVSHKVLAGAAVEVGQWWRVTGSSSQFKREVHGFQVTEVQIKAEILISLLPSGEHIVAFMSDHDAFVGIGPVKARRLWETYGERLYDVLDRGDVAALAAVLSKESAAQVAEAWTKCGDGRTLQWLQAKKFDVSIGRKVIQFFGRETSKKLEEDPYRLLSFCATWRQVDQLAQEHFLVKPDDPRRLQGAIEEACYRLFGDGHTSALSHRMMSILQGVLGTQTQTFRWRHLVESSLSAGLTNGSFLVGPHGVQPLGAYAMERQVALAVASRLRSSSKQLLPEDEIESILAEYEKAEGIDLNADQRKALLLASAQTFTLITGGAGVGKTTVLKALYSIFDKAGIAITQLALAGRAAKRMQEATGRPASTIAAFLRGAKEGSFDERAVFVVDEASLVDIISMSRLCDVFGDAPRIVLVGDPAQLMPVGPGLVLHALTKVQAVPLAQLTVVKRYGGQIAEAAMAIRNGQWPNLPGDVDSDIAFLSCDVSVRDGRSDLSDIVLDLFKIDPENSQILCSRRGGVEGTKGINALCQRHFTSSSPPVLSWSDQHSSLVHTGFHLGDRILCIKNLWDHGLQNGSIGKIIEVTHADFIVSADDDAGPRSIALAWADWDDGVRRPVTDEILDYLELGYAITTHKAQGSQWRRAIVPVAQNRLLDRTLLYTAITRAQSQVLLVGDLATARNAVEAEPKSQGRNVALDLHLAHCLSKEEGLELA
jgi:exodeoxyribonuclease V alpha subunit